MCERGRTGTGVLPRPGVRVRVVARAEYARVRYVVRKQVAQPVHVIACHLLLIAMAVQVMARDDAVRMSSAGDGTKWWNSALGDRVGVFARYLQPFLDCTSCMYWRGGSRRLCWRGGRRGFCRSLLSRYNMRRRGFAVGTVPSHHLFYDRSGEAVAAFC